jgi:hypothetical protein
MDTTKNNIMDNLIETFEIQNLPSTPYLMARLNEEMVAKIKEMCVDVTNNPFNVSQSNFLAGNLKEQYKFPEKQENFLLSVVSPLANSLFNNSTIAQTRKFDYKIQNRDVTWEHQNCWVNFQKKYEFNPIHNHSGYFSYVLWVDIPYSIQDELNLDHTKNGTIPCASMFGFTYPDVVGGIRTFDFPLSKEDNGLLCMFDARLSHSVNPFYTSDEDRISISGNLVPSQPHSKPNYKYH